MGNNDIDFDELDRAVSSLVGRPTSQKDASVAEPVAEPAASPQPMAPEPPQVTAAPLVADPQPEVGLPGVAQPAESVPVASAASSAPSEQPKTFSTPPVAPLPPAKEVTSASLPMRQPEPSVPMKAPERAMPPATRRSGRFMDVVHPSSDMGVAKTAPRPTQGPATQAPQPITTAPEEPEFSFASEPAPVAPPKPESETKWGGSLNFLSRRKKEDEPPKEESQSSAAAPQQDALISPFLSDAKVEKRPLGAFAPGDMPVQSPDMPTQAERPVVDAQKAPEALPPELGQDLVAIEAGEIKSDDRPDTPPAYPPDEPVQQPSVPQVPASPEKPPTPTVRQAMAATATASIPQQYKVKPAPEDTAPRSLFDADEYRQPLQPTTKKKRGAGTWITVILLLLLLGAAAGIAVYFMTGGFN
ncbi:MAG TPA: hypothetical protein VFZ48_01640 [Candidatus Saccharimonadales bacterium]